MEKKTAFNKADLIEAIKQVEVTTTTTDLGECVLTNAAATRVVNMLLGTIVDHLKTVGHTVTLTGFASLERVTTKERHGRNPHTGEEMTIPASTRIRFKAGSELK